MQAEDMLIASKAISELKLSVDRLFIDDCKIQAFRLPAVLSTRDSAQSISVALTDLGVEAMAKGWPVRVGDNWHWRLEYVFSTTIDEVKHEVARVYFNDDGNFETADHELITTSYNRDSVGNALCGFVLSSAFQSSLFAPKPNP